MFFVYFERARGIPHCQNCRHQRRLPLKHYIEQIKADSVKVQTDREGAAREGQRDNSIQCDTPLTDQIEDLMRSLPPA